MSNPRAVALLSGGLDSATTLAIALREGYEVHALSFDYGQRHRIELDRAARIAQTIGAASHKVIVFDLRAIGGSALTSELAVPKADPAAPVGEGIPITYVPARNTIFLSFALAYAETLGAAGIFIGVNALDYSGYPDCRPEYYRIFNQLIRAGTRPETRLEILTPLIHLRKHQIVHKGIELGAPFHLSWSCYRSSEEACGTCDSCALRLRAFEQAGVEDAIPYRVRPSYHPHPAG